MLNSVWKFVLVSSCQTITETWNSNLTLNHSLVVHQLAGKFESGALEIIGAACPS